MFGISLSVQVVHFDKVRIVFCSQQPPRHYVSEAAAECVDGRVFYDLDAILVTVEWG